MTTNLDNFRVSSGDYFRNPQQDLFVRRRGVEQQRERRLEAGSFKDKQQGLLKESTAGIT